MTVKPCLVEEALAYSHKITGRKKKDTGKNGLALFCKHEGCLRKEWEQ